MCGAGFPVFKPLGDTGIIGRVKYWHLALGVYAPVVASAILMAPKTPWLALPRSCGLGVAVGAPIFLLIPLAIAASAGSDVLNDDAGTLSSSGDSALQLIWRQWAHLAVRALGLLFLLLPCYAGMTLVGAVGQGPLSRGTVAFSNKVYMGLLVMAHGTSIAALDVDKVTTFGLRLLNDASVLVLAVSTALWIGAKVRSRKKAVLVSCVVGSILLIVLFSHDTWNLILQKAYANQAVTASNMGDLLDEAGDFEGHVRRMRVISFSVGLAVLAARLLAAALAVHLAVRFLGSRIRVLRQSPARDAR